MSNDGIKVFGLDSVAERNFILRAQRVALAERYNAPQVYSCTFLTYKRFVLLTMDEAPRLRTSHNRHQSGD